MVSAAVSVAGTGDDLGRHRPAGGVLRVREELPNLRGLVPLHERQDLVASAVGQVRDKVRGIVRAHLLEDVCRSLRVEILQHLHLRVRLHLLHRVRDRLVVQRCEHARAVLRRQLVDDRGEVRGVELGERAVRDAELHRGDRALDRIDVLPVDVALLERELEASREGPERPFQPEPPEQARRPDIDGDEAHRALDDVQADVVHPDHPAPVDVDDLLVHEVRPEEDLVRALLELRDVEHRGAQPGAANVQGFDRGPGHEDLAPVGGDDEPGHRRIAFADRDDQVGHLADRIVVLVANGSPDRLAQVQHVRASRAAGR
jgi:hypothetical protein